MAGTSKMKLIFAEKGSKTISNVNPEAEDTAVKSAADLFVEMQSREVESIHRIDERVLTEA